MLLRGYKLTWVFLWPAWSLWFMWCLNVNGDVVLTNNGYKGVTVALSPRLSAENLPPEFLRDLLELLNSASQAVFKETDDRAFFEEVTLVVPESLDAENFLNGTTIKTSSNPSFKSAHVLIESDDGALFGRSPYTLQYGPCGTPGLRIVLPVSNVLGQNGSAMAREWFRLRYGVFAEEFIPNDPLYSEHSPSKQKVLCATQTCRDVVMRSSDFSGINLSRGSPFKRVSLSIIKEAPLRLVVVWNVGSTKVHEVDKYAATQRALWKFARLEAPHGAELGIIFYGTEIFETSGMFLHMSTTENRKKFAEGFPTTLTRGADVTQALTKARDILAASHNPDGGSILLITEENVPTSDVNAARIILEKSNLKLNALIVGQQDGGNGLEELCSGLGGKVLSVPKAPEAVSITLQSNAIASLVLRGNSREETYSPINVETVVVDATRSDEDVAVPIDVDLQSAKVLRVSVITENIDRTGPFQYSLKLSSPRGDAEYTLGSSNLDMEFHQREFRISSPTSGRWTLHMTKVTTVSNPIIVDVKLEPRIIEDVPITLDTWLSSSFSDVDPSRALILYAELKKGSKPVRYATVTARVTVPDGTEVKVELVDNGAGDPDITAGDGIYSRYFTLFSDKGRYSLSVVAQGSEKTVIVGAEQQADDLDSRCCGSEFPTTGSRPSGSFTRNVQYGSFFVISQKPPGDIYPPSRIVDLKVLNVEADTMRVTLRWTAPGNDFDQGKAKGYDIRYFDRAVNFAEDFDTEGTKIDPFNIDGLSGSPKLYGEIEEASVFNFKCSRGPSSCFFAIRAYDEVRSGPVSNVVEVTFPELTSTDDTDPSFNPHTDGNGSLVQEDNDRNYARGGLTTWQLGLAVAVPLLIFIVLIILLVMCFFFRRRGNDDSKESSPPPPTRPRPIISAPMRTKESTPKPVIKDENKNHYAVSVLSGSTISPVNSYSADYLMDKYEEETKQKQNGVKAPTAPSRSDVGSSDGDTSMDTAVGEQNWWTPRARNSQEMGLPLNPTYLDRARPANNLGAASSGNVPALPRRKHTFV